MKNIIQEHKAKSFRFKIEQVDTEFFLSVSIFGIRILYISLNDTVEAIIEAIKQKKSK
jgi:hypothetical protein